MIPNLDDILSTLQMHGGALTHPHPPQHSSNDPSHEVRQSTEVSETQSTVTQLGSTTVERTTTAQIKTESVPAPSISGIGVGQAAQPGAVQGLLKGKLYSSPLPKSRSEITLHESPKLGELEGSKKRSAESDKGVQETRKVARGPEREDAQNEESDVPPGKKSGEKQGEEPSTSMATVKKPVVSPKGPAAPPEKPAPPLEKPTPPPVSSKPTPPRKTTPKQPPAKKLSPSPSPKSPIPPPKKAPN